MPSASAPPELSYRGHLKAECGARTKRGTVCSKTAGFGTDHVGFGQCKHHGGSTANGIKFAAKLQAAALAADEDRRLDGRTLELVVDPFDAVLKMLYKAAGWEAFCTRKVVALEEATLLVDHERVTTTSGDGLTRVERSNERSLHVWVVEQQRARSEVARLAKVAIDAGVAERYVRVAEQTAELVARAFDHLIGELDLSPAQLERAPAAVRRSLQLVEAPAAA